MHKQPLSSAIRQVLLASAATVAGIFLAGQALAQQVDPDDEQSGTRATTLDRIEVTGSRIRQVDIESAAPVLTISREDIENQGFQSVGEILLNVAAVGAPAISRAQSLTAGENTGGQTVNMRSLGTVRTLVLVDGKRLGISTGGVQDISLIPTSAVERIEVLKDGASSIYGSDAIAGVVNIITRTNFEGATGQAYFGQYSEGDGEITRGDFVMGFTGDRGSLTTAVEYRKEEGVMAGDRPFTAFPHGPDHPTRGWTTVSQWGVINLPDALGGNRVLDQGADWRDIANYHALNTNNGGAAADPEGSPVDKSNTNTQMHLRTPLENRSLFVNGDYDITDAIRFRGSMMYSQREAETQVAGYPFTSESFGITMSPDSYYNPVGSHHGFDAPQAVGFWRRSWEVPRLRQSSRTTWRFAAGLEGSFDIGDRYFDWDVGYLYNNSITNQRETGQLNVLRVAQAVGPSFLNADGVVQCGTAAAPIALADCVPWNPFIPFGREGDGGLSGNQALTDFLFPTLHNTGETSTRAFNANLTGSLFSLPAGDLAFAVGAESRKEAGEFVPDAMAASGIVTSLAAGPTRGSYRVDELYAELAVPLLADVAGAEELSLSVASRYSDYDTFGDTTNSKVGLKWKPIESLLVRGTWAEGFRAPTIANLFGGGSQTYIAFKDPCDTNFGSSATNATTRANCVAAMGDLANTYRQLGQGFTPVTDTAQPPVPYVSGSNPDLQPETSESRTLGVVWSPDFVRGLNLSLDWWNIRIEDTIVADSPTQMLNDCYIQGIASRCSSFTRHPVLGYVDQLKFGQMNAGYRETEGFDFDLGYRFWTEKLGSFNLAWQTTYTAKDEIKTSNEPTALPLNLVGYTSTASLLGTFRIRSNASLTWSQGVFGATWGARFFSSLKDNCLSAALFPDECGDPGYVAGNPEQSGAIKKNGSVTFQDIELRWNVPWDATVALGANNVFDRQGAQTNAQSNSSFRYHGLYDIGRFMYMKYQQRF